MLTSQNINLKKKSSKLKQFSDIRTRISIFCIRLQLIFCYNRKLRERALCFFRIEDITVFRGKDNILDSSRNVPTSISGRPAGRNFLIARQESRPII